MYELVQQAAIIPAATGPMILLRGMEIERPVDVVQATALSADDKRIILAAWASDFHAIDSKPAFRHLPGTAEPVSIDEVQMALKELDRRYGY